MHVPESRTPEEAHFTGRLDDRVLGVLQDLPGRIAFSGLRRSLRAHPESLARALRRLEREGLVERTAEGYRAISAPTGSGDALEGMHHVAEVALPPGASTDAVLRRLSGRWFGSLRWMGEVERPPDRFLAWAHRDGTGTVLLGRAGSTLRIYTTVRPELGAEGDAEDAAYELLVALADVLRPKSTERAGWRGTHASVATMEMGSAGGVSGPASFDNN
jgi:DNA-binding Lrp family transcriptional regulator